MAKQTRNKKSKNTQYSKKRIISTIAFILVLVIIAIVFYYFSPKFKELFAGNNSNSLTNSSVETITGEIQNDGDLVMHVVNVGQGDAIILQFPNGYNMLIDAGSETNSKNNNDYLITYINNLGITKFNYFLATHQDEDHIGLVEDVFDNFEIEFVFRPYVYSDCNSKDYSIFPESFNIGHSSGEKSTTVAYYYFLERIVKEGSQWAFFNKDSDFNIEIEDENGNIQACSFDFLTPTADVENIAYSNANSYSPICMLSYAGKKIMLTGDAEEDVEEEFLNYYAQTQIDFDVDVLKVGHHGSRSSSTQEFLSFINPEYALISCGIDNSYYHPHQETLDKFRADNVLVSRTDMQGSIVVTIEIDGDMFIDTPEISVPVENLDNLYVAPIKP